MLHRTLLPQCPAQTFSGDEAGLCTEGDLSNIGLLVSFFAEVQMCVRDYRKERDSGLDGRLVWPSMAVLMQVIVKWLGKLDSIHASATVPVWCWAHHLTQSCVVTVGFIFWVLALRAWWGICRSAIQMSAVEKPMLNFHLQSKVWRV